MSKYNKKREEEVGYQLARSVCVGTGGIPAPCLFCCNKINKIINQQIEKEHTGKPESTARKENSPVNIGSLVTLYIASISGGFCAKLV